MLAIQKTRTSDGKCTPNILPCRINHTGPTKVTKRFWKPTTENDGFQTSYFRGRKLRGRSVKLPPSYEGVIWKSTDKSLPQQPSRRPIAAYEDDDLSGEEEEEAPETVKVIEQVSTFDDILVWGHDHIPSESDDFVKGVEEWISLAEAIHRPTTSETAPVRPGE